jgi:uncharacterized protein (TIGR03437 family)
MKGFLAILFLSGSAVFAQSPAVSAGGILNAASFDTTMPVTPGSLISIFGTGLSSGTATADSIPLSTTLGNVSVTISGVPVPLYFVTHESTFDQINAQLPWNVPTGTAQIVVTNSSGQPSPPQTFQVGQFSPGIFTVNGSGTGQGIVVNSDYVYAAPAGSIPGLTTRPASVSDPNGIIIFATGLGVVSPAIDSGASPSATILSNTTTVPVVLVGGVPGKVLFSGLAPGDVGVYQLNVVLGAGTPTGSAVSLQIQMGTVTSTNKVTMAVGN